MNSILRFFTVKQLIIAGALLIFVSGCTTATKNFEPGVIPPYVEVEQGKADEIRSSLHSMMEDEDLELQQSGAGYERVKKIINRLSEAANVQQELDVYTVDAGENANAFAMGGNTIVVYQELLDRLPGDEELAVVLSHEMAHLLGQHTSDTTMQKRGAAWGLAAAVLGAVVTVATDGSTIAGDLAEASTSVVGSGVVNSYSRAMEHEADHIGILLMAKVGYDPASAIELWEKADTVLGESNGITFFSTHPSHDNRKERLEEGYVLAKPLYEQTLQ